MDNEKRADSKEEAQVDDHENYPPLKVVIPATGALYLAVFLVALVRLFFRTNSLRIYSR